MRNERVKKAQIGVELLKIIEWFLHSFENLASDSLSFRNKSLQTNLAGQPKEIYKKLMVMQSQP